ncbi:MAG: hypothetical protein KKE17_06740 [Proteobacteria bacterium]|nr:hypothetical protein [Pseudomonadota bacterium]MBU1709685.1 hypothetical protein [Pseudomonadota bacterium]
MQKTIIFKFIQFYVLAFFLVLSMHGCGDPGSNHVSSRGVTTESISADMHVSSSDGEVVTVEAAIKEGTFASGFYIDLAPEDIFMASVVGEPSSVRINDNLFENTSQLEEKYKRLTQGTRDVFGISQDGIWYYTTFGGTDENTEITISLLREQQNDAPRTIVKLPPAFEILEPLAGQAFSRSSDAITVGWNQGSLGDVMRLKGFVSCLNNSNGVWSSPEITDTGSYVINAGTFSGYTGSCSVSIGVERFRLGQLDPAFGNGGKIEAHQYRMVMIFTVE